MIGITKIIIIIGIILLLGIQFIFRMKIPTETKLSLLFSCLSTLTVFSIVYNVYLTTNFSIHTEMQKESDNTLKQIMDSFIEPQSGLINLYPESYWFYKSINPHKQNLQVEEPSKYDPVKRIAVEDYYCKKIFQIVENIQSSNSFRLDIDDIPWTNVFILWFHSDILKNNWKHEKIMYADKTREYITEIINAVNDITHKYSNINEYMNEIEKYSININKKIFNRPKSIV